MVRISDLYEGARLRVVHARDGASKRNGDCYINGDVWTVTRDSRGRWRMPCWQSQGMGDSHEFEEDEHLARFEFDEGPW